MKLIDAELLEKATKLEEDITNVWEWYLKQCDYDEDFEFDLTELLFILDDMKVKLNGKREE